VHVVTDYADSRPDTTHRRPPPGRPIWHSG
jgi:hypothetical protein